MSSSDPSHPEPGSSIPDRRRIMCPSSVCSEGATLLGIVKGNGTISFVKEKLTVTKNFVEISKTGRKPESRFRFANTCLQAPCVHWKENKCSLVDNMVNVFSKVAADVNDLPECTIRSDCRWYDQHGSKACTVCPYLIYELDPS